MCLVSILRSCFNIGDECGFSWSLIQVEFFDCGVRIYGITGFLLYVKVRFIWEKVGDAGEGWWLFELIRVVVGWEEQGGPLVG